MSTYLIKSTQLSRLGMISITRPIAGNCRSSTRISGIDEEDPSGLVKPVTARRDLPGGTFDTRTFAQL